MKYDLYEDIQRKQSLCHYDVNACVSPNQIASRNNLALQTLPQFWNTQPVCKKSKN